VKLARALQHDVPHRTRVKGADYFHRGAVIQIAPIDRGIEAIVRGTADYRVTIGHESGGFTGSCECPYFTDRVEICKHIWAVVLSPQAEAALAASGPIAGKAWIDPVLTRAAQSDGRHRKHTPEAWQHFLSEVQRQHGLQGPGPDLRRLRDQLVYVLNAESSASTGAAHVAVLVRSRRKDGEWAKPIALAAHEIDRLAGEDDIEILSLLEGGERAWSYVMATDRPHQYALKGPLQRRLLPMIARTGRALVSPGGRDAPVYPIALDEGPPWKFELLVTSSASDGFRIDGVLQRGDERLSVAEPPLVLPEGFVVTRETLAPLETSGAFAWLVQLRRSGAVTVPETGSARLTEMLARAGFDPDRLPEALRFEVVDATPRPGILIRRNPARFAYAREDLATEVQFDYAGTVVGAGTAAVFDPAHKRLVRRDSDAEQQAFDRIAELGFRKAWDHAQGRRTLSIPAEQFPHIVRALVGEGWRVEAEGRVFRAPRDLQVEITSGIDWFELRGRVDFGDGMSAPLPAVLAAFERGDGTVTLGDGTKGLVPEEWLKRYAGIARFGETEGDHVRYKRSQAALLDALLESQPVSVDATFARARQALQSFSGVGPLDPPSSFRGHLREYQREALGWLEFLRRFGLGGCLEFGRANF
jgi:hypothetical protein